MKSFGILDDCLAAGMIRFANGMTNGMEGILMVHSYQTACTCGYSIIFLSFVKSVKLFVLAVATMI